MKVRLFGFLIGGVLLVTACGGEPSPQGSVTQVAPMATQPATKSAPATAQPAAQNASAATQPTEQARMDRPEQPNSAQQLTGFNNIQSGLDTLDSYRIRYAIQFEGKDEDGKELKTTADFLSEIAQTGDQRVRMSGTQLSDSNPVTTNIEIITLGGVRYWYAEEGGSAQCISLSSNELPPNSSPIMQPADVFGSIEDLRLVEKNVTVNGLVTDRYQVQQASLNAGQVGEFSGEVWLTQDGKLVVKYIGSARGKLLLLAGDSEGSINWEYQLESVNDVASIQLPAECEAQKPLDDIPIPASAKDRSQISGLITFTADDAPAAIAEFYEAELPKLGWAKADASELGDMRTLEFTKQDRTLNITVTPADKGSSVIILEKRGG